MKRQLTTLIAGLALSASALSACTAPNAESTDTEGASGETTINLLGPDDPSTFAPAIEAFETKNPGYKVNFTQVPFDQLNSVLQQRLAAKDDTIDVFTVDQPRVSQLAAQGYLVDLSDLKDEAKAATSQAMYDVNIYQDKMWALSIWNSTQLLYYNTDALAAAGVEPPSIDPAERWTWEQTTEAATQAQAAGTPYGLLLEQTSYYYQLQPLMESLGGGSGITGEDMLTPDVTNDSWVEAMTWYRDTFESGLSVRGVGFFEANPMFKDGKLAFFVGGPWDLATFAENTFDWGVAPMPYFDGGSEVTPTGSWSWGINPASKNVDAAKKFLEFAALDPEGNLAVSQMQTNIPANNEALPAYFDRMNAIAGENSAGVGDLMQYEIDTTSLPRPLSVGYVQFEEVINKAFEDIRNGADPKQRLTEASAQLDDAWKQIK